MKISIKQLRKVIREVLEETSKRRANVNESKAKDDLDEMDVLEADCDDDMHEADDIDED